METDRIRIYPANREQMESSILAEKDDELKKAYGEMLDGCLAHPDQWDWYAMWMIEKTDGTHIGDLCFKGLEEENPEIGYGILEEFQGNGYATEAVKLALKWAFDHPGIIAVEAETDPVTCNNGNVSLRHVACLEKNFSKNFNRLFMTENGGEVDEVDDIKWIPIKDIDKYQWAFHHKDAILPMFKKLTFMQKFHARFF